ncbi:HAD family hydrolase [Xenorhabdus sp. BG5]|uniref:HAD family hydrolase n=1 Tax=Xenorhabdus sp. BG5 TaxID=2782014 RepID=UPI00188065D5|nr:HAD family hydrolase [Xenorhabdus sp. BG5]MBE8597079.1 HAD family hydrolase [Xenorhabdus sp. BG5]
MEKLPLTEPLLINLVMGKKLVFFDCDGVLIDSNNIKLAAVSDALYDLPQSVLMCCLQNFKMNFGRSRIWHFEAFYRIANPSGVTEHHFIHDRIQRYEKYLKEHYILSLAVNGAKPLLEKLTSAGITCLVISGGKETEIKTILNQVGLSHYFKQIVGSPVVKEQAISTFLTQYQCTPEQTVFFGDAQADAQAAMTGQVPFLFVRQHALVESSVIHAHWPTYLWGGEITDLTPEQTVRLFPGIHSNFD